MKNVSINLAAAWDTFIRSFQDGNIFRESNIDLATGDIADRLGYLKNKADLAGYLAGTNVWTAANEFQSTVTVTGGNDVDLTDAVLQAGNSNFAGEAEFDDVVHMQGGVAFNLTTLADANATLAASTYEHRVPTLTANRVYTLPATTGLNDGHKILMARLRTADAFTATLQDPTGPTTLGIVSASTAGYIVATKKGSSWVVSQWGGTLTSLLTSV